VKQYDLKIIETGMRLREAAPVAWQEFVEALRMRSASLTGDLVRAPPDTFQQMQGKAREAVEFAQQLMDLHKTFETIQNRQREVTR
jgi:hypothetical protein